MLPDHLTTRFGCTASSIDSTVFHQRLAPLWFKALACLNSLLKVTRCGSRVDNQLPLRSAHGGWA
eukprot:1024136-Amphidinium_carterae.1